VAIADLCPVDDETMEKMTAFGVQVKAYRVDVSNHKEILDLKAKLTEEFGEIDILVNNAGLISYKSISEQSYEEIEKLTRVNVNSVIFVSWHLMAHLNFSY
jgi:3-oxoacyl-[acyl-carrier protein] reductase